MQRYLAVFTKSHVLANGNRNAERDQPITANDRYLQLTIRLRLKYKMTIKFYVLQI